MLPSCFRVSATYRVSHLQRAAGSSVPTKKLPGTCFPEKRLFLLCLHALKLPSAYFVDAAMFLGTNFLPRSSSSLMKCQRSPLGSFLLNFSFLAGFRDGKAFSFSSPLLLSVHSTSAVLRPLFGNIFEEGRGHHLCIDLVSSYKHHSLAS